MSLRLTILSPERRLVEDGHAEEVTLQTSEGQVQILPGHAAMVGTLDTGFFTYQNASGEKTSGVISSGFFEVKDDRVSLMAETLELRSEIDVDRARRAQKIAEDALKDAELDEHKFKKYQLKLQRSMIRQQMAGKEHPEE